MFAHDIDDPDMPLQVLFQHSPNSASVFLAHGMLCFGCPIAPFHTVIDACLEYGLDEIRFRRELLATLSTGGGVTSRSAPTGPC